MDPFANIPTLNVICEILDPMTLIEYPFDPRSIANKAMTYLQGTGIADQAFFGPECEFFILDDVRFEQSASHGSYRLDSIEAPWNRNRDEAPNLGHKLGTKQGYLPCPPGDQLMDIRNEIMVTLQQAGIEVECHHHEVASAGLSEVDFRYSDLVSSADNVMLYKYIVKNVAKTLRENCHIHAQSRFSGDNGSGCIRTFHFGNGGESLMAGRGYAGLSETGLYMIGGILRACSSLDGIDESEHQ